MPFPASWKNPHIVGGKFLVITFSNKDITLSLDTCLGNARGKFQWGGRDAMSNAKGASLSGSDLTAQLPHNGRAVEAHIDLSERIKIISGRLVYAPPSANSDMTSPPSTTPATRNESTASRSVSPSSPPPSYEDSFAEQFSEFKSSHKSSYSARSSSYFKFSLRDKPLRLVGSILHAECRRAGQKEYVHSELDLNSYIGVIDGQLVWGREGFFLVSQNIRLEEFTLHAECKTDSETTSHSSLDLSRYLQTYDGILGVKVATGTTEISTLFSEASWMKFKVVTEPDPVGVLGTLGDQAAFKTAFSALATTTSEHVVAEMTQELSVAAAQYVKSAVTDTVKAKMTEIVTNAVSARVREEITKKVDEAFAVARESVLKACYDMADEAANDVTIQYTQSVVGPMEDKITESCNKLVEYALREVSESAIGQFQERAEILMEREIVGAGIRRAETQARLLKMLAATF
ncbi:hypothetical protein F5050DRAFT_1708822 [Lentinula boryana]|uniref:Cyanovirin-N domain-containing protein n=1 Tax=Lentinula boryana TaxID=40481 RepID=A0ABQ8QPG3_9AGAR|nr:hypothetical protein F5050DRAFT_1708822 [Lentinula boryana]